MKNDPAFPVPDMADYNGMYLRDYFAAKAMAVYWEGPDDPHEISCKLPSIAEWCYEMADAMLEARKK